MNSSIENKIESIKNSFSGLSTDARLQRLIEMGRALPPFPPESKIVSNQVSGCQSILYLASDLREGKVFFQASSDALISAGLAALLIAVYSGEEPSVILKRAPDFLTDIGILASLTPSRSNGLAHIHQRMKRDALKFLVSAPKHMEFNSQPL
jgi:cysteine desulfuration protein SufE